MAIDDTKNFYSKVYELAMQIPRGKVTTYGAIAETLGVKSAARSVGWALNSLAGKNSEVPCHRVVNRNGLLSGARFFESPDLMRQLLENEGVKFNGDAVDIKNHFWHPIKKS